MLEALKAIERLEELTKRDTAQSRKSAIYAIRYVAWVRRQLKKYRPETSAMYDANLRDIQWHIRWAMHNVNQVEDTIKFKRAQAEQELDIMLVAMAEEAGEE